MFLSFKKSYFRSFELLRSPKRDLVRFRFLKTREPILMRSLIGAPSPIRQSDQVQHKVQFLAILNALGQSFLQPDIVVFKQNLNTLEKLNEKWKLYHKVLCESYF